MEHFEDGVDCEVAVPGFVSAAHCAAGRRGGRGRGREWCRGNWC